MESVFGISKCTLRLSDKECNCRLRCSSCGICVHTYTCSCVDYAVHCQMKSATATTTYLITEVGELTSFLQRADAVYTIIKTKYRGLVNKLQQFLDDDGCDEETFQAGISHLTSAVGVMNSMNVQQLIPAKELHQIQTVHVNPGSILQRGNAYQTTSKRPQNLQQLKWTSANLTIISERLRHVFSRNRRQY